MSYSLVTAPKADEDLERLPPRVRIGILRELLRCAEHPSQHAISAAPSISGMILPLEVPFDDMTAYAEALFQYEQDEQSLYV